MRGNKIYVKFQHTRARKRETKRVLSLFTSFTRLYLFFIFPYRTRPLLCRRLYARARATIVSSRYYIYIITIVTAPDTRWMDVENRFRCEIVFFLLLLLLRDNHLFFFYFPFIAVVTRFILFPGPPESSRLPRAYYVYFYKMCARLFSTLSYVSAVRIFIRIFTRRTLCNAVVYTHTHTPTVSSNVHLLPAASPLLSTKNISKKIFETEFRV